MWPLPWIDHNEAKSLGGKWVNIKLFEKSGDIQWVEEEPLFDTENRIGIGLTYKTRTAAEGRLYTAQHIRLREGVSIVVALDNSASLQDRGILRLGGEGRKCAYKKMEETEIPRIDWNAQSAYYVSLAPICCTEELLPKAFCGKIFSAAGWDLAKKYHKPSETWFNAGSVFMENINKQCIALWQ